MNLTKEMKDAAAAIRTLKIAQPYIFTEYRNLLDAQAELRKARREYDRALKAWEQLGRDA